MARRYPSAEAHRVLGWRRLTHTHARRAFFFAGRALGVQNGQRVVGRAPSLGVRARAVMLPRPPPSLLWRGRRRWARTPTRTPSRQRRWRCPPFAVAHTIATLTGALASCRWRAHCRGGEGTALPSRGWAHTVVTATVALPPPHGRRAHCRSVALLSFRRLWWPLAMAWSSQGVVRPGQQYIYLTRISRGSKPYLGKTRRCHYQGPFNGFDSFT